MANTEYLFGGPKDPQGRIVHGSVFSSQKFAAYTLLEILISVTLMLMLMYGVAAIFSRVGGIMNSTQSTMEMANNLRNAKNRLENDLRGITAPLTPPLNSTSNSGYFCYIEGLGASYTNLLNRPAVDPGYTSFSSAIDTDRSQLDNTVGDVDDILMFTAKAPAGKFFRGRMGDNNIVESEYAEIVWFLRGTTLYRRVLLIVPDTELQRALQSKSVEVKQGYGFFREFDVSVHLTASGSIVANTLGDLSNRANRYGFWRSMNNYVPIPPDSPTPPVLPYFDPHGQTGAWYWLRLPTMQESATYTPGNIVSTFRAGVPFGSIVNGSLVDSDKWDGFGQGLDTTFGESDTRDSNVLPDNTVTPFIDYWHHPNCWNQTDSNSGDLRLSLNDAQIYSQDVLLTNVIAFDVKAWDDKINKFVDLGEVYRTPNTSPVPSNGFRDMGYYTALSKFPLSVSELNRYIPAVFDTWTEQYQLEFMKDHGGVSFNRSDFTAENIPLNGKITSAHLPDFPPPYDIPLKAIQVELRAFDPRSGNIRNMTLNVDFNSL